MKTAFPKTPHHNTYWVITGRLLAGEYPGDRSEAPALAKLGPFIECGVDSFLDLTGPQELVPYAHLLGRLNGSKPGGLCHKRHWIPDMGVPDRPETMRAVQLEIRNWLEAGRCVYVHCWGGVGRTGTVIGCQLVEQGLSGTAALARMVEFWKGVSDDKRRRHPRSPQTDEQEAYVRSWIPG